MPKTRSRGSSSPRPLRLPSMWWALVASIVAVHIASANSASACRAGFVSPASLPGGILGRYAPARLGISMARRANKGSQGPPQPDERVVQARESKQQFMPRQRMAPSKPSHQLEEPEAIDSQTRTLLKPEENTQLKTQKCTPMNPDQAPAPPTMLWHRGSDPSSAIKGHAVLPRGLAAPAEKEAAPAPAPPAPAQDDSVKRTAAAGARAAPFFTLGTKPGSAPKQNLGDPANLEGRVRILQAKASRASLSANRARELAISKSKDAHDQEMAAREAEDAAHAAHLAAEDARKSLDEWNKEHREMLSQEKARQDALAPRDAAPEGAEASAEAAVVHAQQEAAAVALTEEESVGLEVLGLERASKEAAIAANIRLSRRGAAALPLSQEALLLSASPADADAEDGEGEVEAAAAEDEDEEEFERLAGQSVEEALMADTEGVLESSAEAEEEEGGAEGGARRAEVPGLVVLDMDAVLLETMPEDTAGPPYSREARTGCVVDADGAEVQLVAGAHEVLRMMHERAELAGTRLALLSKTSRLEWAMEVLEQVEIAQGVSAASMVDFTEVTSGLKGLQATDTLRAVLASSALRTLKRKADLEFSDILFIGRESRTCHDLAKLGVVCQRAPYGLSGEVWRSALSAFTA